MDCLVGSSRVIAIIPARGGSKRLPRKNIIDFCDRPMIAWTIQAAIDSNLFDRILVSTDDIEIAEVSRTYGLEIPFFRQDALDDYSSASAATLAALKQAMTYWGESYTYVVQLMANCPLRNSYDIHRSFSEFVSNQRDFQISCFRFGWMNPWWAATLDEHGRPQHKFPSALNARSQDLPPLYCPSGAIWIAKAEMLIRAESFYGSGYSFKEIPWWSAVDIDDSEDLKFAEAVYMMRSRYSKS